MSTKRFWETGPVNFTLVVAPQDIGHTFESSSGVALVVNDDSSISGGTSPGQLSPGALSLTNLTPIASL